MYVRFGQVDLDEPKRHVQVIRIVCVPIFGWFDDVLTNIGNRILKCI